jgi:hypothetical protein
VLLRKASSACQPDSLRRLMIGFRLLTSGGHCWCDRNSAPAVQPRIDSTPNECVGVLPLSLVLLGHKRTF